LTQQLNRPKQDYLSVTPRVSLSRKWSKMDKRTILPKEELFFAATKVNAPENAIALWLLWLEM